jgi:transcriptional regulator with XRE-family HTH domain
MAAAYDERLGQLLRLIRGRSGLTQKELAAAAGVPLHDIWLIENGRAAEVRLERVRRAFAAVGGQARITASWNGAAADRLLDEKHALIGEVASTLYARRHWETAIEVTFNEYGDRGSIDLLAGFKAMRAVAVNEVKSALGSLEETNRSLDVKERLAAKIAYARFGWKPAIVAKILIVPNEMTVRRVVAAHESTMAASYPARSREIRAWLRNPDRPLRGIWFVSIQRGPKDGNAQQPQVGSNRRQATPMKQVASDRPG